MVAGLADFLKHPDSLESVFKVAGSLKDTPLSTQMLSHLLSHPSITSLTDYVKHTTSFTCSRPCPAALHSVSRPSV